MTANEYQKAAMRTASGRCYDIANAAMGISGEAGEVTDLVKKAMFQGHDLSREKVVEELGDLMWYVALMAELIGVTLEDVMVANVEKLWRRYPDGFSERASVHRVDMQS